MDPEELLLTAARALAVYVLMLIVLRALGKRTIGNFSAFDLIVALMLGELADEIIYGDVRMVQGAVAIVGLGAIAYFDEWLSFSSRSVHRLTEGTPTVVIRDGEFVTSGMKEERLSHQDLKAMLRIHAIQDLREVRMAILETDGELSVRRYAWADAARRADVDPTLAKERMEILGGVEEPPLEKRADIL